MILKFRLISNEVKDFVRDIEIRSDQTFHDFHTVISNNCHYDKSQLSSFFKSNAKWEKLQEICLFDFSEGTSPDILLMDKTYLKDYIFEKSERLLYIFDYFNERLFFIELIDILPKENKKNYPRISFSKQSPPPQTLIIDTNFDDLSPND